MRPRIRPAAFCAGCARSRCRARPPMSRGAWVVVAVIVGTGAACKKQSRQREHEPPVVKADAAIVDAMAPDADPFGELPALDDIPALTLAPASKADTAAAKKLASQALKRHLAGDVTGAVPVYKQA